MSGPRKVAGLQSALWRLAAERGVPPTRLQRAVANTVLGQLLPAGVIKGGTGLKLRLEESASRFTPDFDTAFGGDIDRFEDDLTERLSQVNVKGD